MHFESAEPVTDGGGPSKQRALRPRLRRICVGVLAVLPGVGCQPGPAPAEDGRPPAQGYLFQRGVHQGFYDAGGSLRRLLQDENGDGVAETSVLFHPNGRASQIEADTDGDGVVDSWELYTERGDLERRGASEAGNAWPAQWDVVDRDGNVRRREFDGDGDGLPERVEEFLGGMLVGVTLDSDGDGKTDRWQSWRDGRLQTEEFDASGDGRPDGRIRYRPDGRPGGLERITSTP